MRPERRRRGKPAFAAADVENALALERDKVGDRGGLHAGLIASLHRYFCGLYAFSVVPRAPNFCALRRVSSNLERA
jgi:hypothetical protein